MSPHLLKANPPRPVPPRLLLRHLQSSLRMLLPLRALNLPFHNNPLDPSERRRTDSRSSSSRNARTLGLKPTVKSPLSELARRSERPKLLATRTPLKEASRLPQRGSCLPRPKPASLIATRRMHLTQQRPVPRPRRPMSRMVPKGSTGNDRPGRLSTLIPYTSRVYLLV